MRNWKKIVSVVLLAVLLGTGLQMMFEAKVSASSQQELREKMLELQRRLAEVNQQLADAKDSVAEAQVRTSTYASRVSIVKEQIATLQESIDTKSEELAQKQEELDQKIKEHDRTYELFKKRLRAMYMSNDVSTLALIFGSNSFSEFLVAAETQSRISKHDTDLVEKLEMEAKVIEAEQEVIQVELSSLQDDMDVLEEKYSELARLYQEANSDLSAAKALQTATQDDYDAILNSLQETQNEWNSLLANARILLHYFGIWMADAVRSAQLPHWYRYLRIWNLWLACCCLQYRARRARAVLQHRLWLSRHDRPWR